MRRLTRHRLASLLFALSLGLAAACSDDEGSTGTSDVAADGDTGGDAIPDTDAGEDPDTGTPDGTVDGDDDLVADTAPDSEPDTGDPTICPAPPDDLPEVTATPNEDNERRLSLGLLGTSGLRDREIQVYLPVGYDEDTERRYPVLYMHDGQNLFDPREAAFGQAWEIDRTMDALIEDAVIEPWIVVSLDNTADRIPEYTPEGLGEDYVDFLVEVVKPVIDANFRTVCGRANTAVAGSSLGGLISVYIALRYPDVFGRIGAVSPSLWWDDQDMLDRAAAFGGEWPLRLWIDAGTAEGADSGAPGLAGAVADARLLRDLLVDDGLTVGDELGYLEVLDGNHNETAWADRLDTILAFMLTDEVWAPASAESLAAFAAADFLLESGSGQATTLLVDAVFDTTRRLTLPNDDLELTLTPDGVVTLGADGWLTAASAGEVQVDIAYGELETSFDFPVVGDGQATLTFLIRAPSSTPPEDTLYVATDFYTPEEWAPDAVPLRRVDGRWWRGYVLGDDGAPIEFKISRGTWETVEKSNLGAEIANRVDTVDGSRTLVSPARWADTE